MQKNARSVGQCGDCEHKDPVEPSNWYKKTGPRCTQCGGMLDRITPKPAKGSTGRLGKKKAKKGPTPKRAVKRPCWHPPKRQKKDSTVAGHRQGKKQNVHIIAVDGTTEEEVQARYAERGYPAAWNKNLRQSIRARDGGRCVICGRTNAQERRETGMAALPIHHIDMNKANCDPLNLITLCSVCHKSIHDGKSLMTSDILIYMAECSEQRVYIYESG